MKLKLLAIAVLALLASCVSTSDTAEWDPRFDPLSMAGAAPENKLSRNSSESPTPGWSGSGLFRYDNIHVRMFAEDYGHPTPTKATWIRDFFTGIGKD